MSTGGLGIPEAMGNLNNGTVLFRTSNRTAFLLGGWPQGAQVNDLQRLVLINLKSTDSYCQGFISLFNY